MKTVQCALTTVLCAALLTAAALESASQRIEALESLWSVTDAESEIYRANHSGGEAVEVTDEGEILVTEGIADRFTLNEGKTETVRVLEA